jgi:hypothetical protein
MNSHNPEPIQVALERDGRPLIDRLTRPNGRKGWAMVATRAQATILSVMKEGEQTHGESWQTRDDHTDLEHAKRHLNLLEAGDTSEPHLAHALTRLALILARQKENRKNLENTTGKNIQHRR